MKIKLYKSVENNKYLTKIITEANDVDLSLSKKFGEPTVDVGGSFTGPPAFTEPTQFRKIFTGFPYTFTKDGTADAQAKEKSIVWGDTMEQRLQDTINALRNQVDDFTGERVITI